MDGVNSIDAWIDGNALLGGLLVNILAAGLIAAVGSIMKRDDREVLVSAYPGLERLLRGPSTHQPRRPVVRRARKLFFWTTFMLAIWGSGTYLGWRTPPGVFLCLAGLLSLLVCCIYAFGSADVRDSKNAFGAGVFSVTISLWGSSLLGGGETVTGLSFIASAIWLLASAVAFLTDSRMGSSAAPIASSVGDLHSSKVAGSIDRFAWSAASLGWGINFFVDNQSEVSLGFLMLGVCYIAGSVGFFAERESTRKMNAEDLSIDSIGQDGGTESGFIYAGMFRLFLGLASVAWCIALVQESYTAALATPGLLAASLFFLSFGYYSVGRPLMGVINLSAAIVLTSTAIGRSEGASRESMVLASVSAAAVIFSNLGLAKSVRSVTNVDTAKAIYGDRLKLFDASDKRVLNAERKYANALRRSGQPEHAIDVLEPLVAKCEKSLGPADSVTFASRLILGSSLRATGRFGEAVVSHNQLWLDCLAGGAEPDQIIAARLELGRSLRAAGKKRAAIAHAKENKDIAEKKLGAHHFLTKAARREYIT